MGEKYISTGCSRQLGGGDAQQSCAGRRRVLQLKRSWPAGEDTLQPAASCLAPSCMQAASHCPPCIYSATPRHRSLACSSLAAPVTAWNASCALGWSHLSGWMSSDSRQYRFFTSAAARRDGAPGPVRQQVKAKGD